jgi:hypothetical protein
VKYTTGKSEEDKVVVVVVISVVEVSLSLPVEQGKKTSRILAHGEKQEKESEVIKVLLETHK